MNLRMSILEDTFGVCRLQMEEQTDWVQGEFFSITKTHDEISVVCKEIIIPEGIKYEGAWRIMKVEGPLDFSLIGILAFISEALANRGISIFALSTYDTDYILVKEGQLEEAIHALEEKGVHF